ncbi:unnamed protein product [Moneuplotes crassus]|uniref:Uncharacterized protein n=1 Tax=Euplotes crassus TaxID=5936 RepID=A0AAD1ULI3_EUPCR|nr:unnamed protein product [Moneuplotes crassus]
MAKLLILRCHHNRSPPTVARGGGPYCLHRDPRFPQFPQRKVQLQRKRFKTADNFYNPSLNTT